MFYLHLRSVLSPLRCSQIIEQSTLAGFEAAKVNNYGNLEQMSNVRNNERLEMTDRSLAQLLSSALEESAGGRFPRQMEGQGYSHLSDFFRIYRYTPGQYFKPHRDGDVEVDGSVGLVTVLVYLNDADGGETILMPKGYAYKDDWIYIKPRAGDVLMFEHAFWHEGRPVISGEKFVLRTDLFYN
jgi:prolyl 4-hydroxylase